MIADRWLQIDQVFLAALERAPHDRAEFLDDACGGDLDLRTQVERLIALDELQECLLDTSVIEVAAGLLGPARPELAEGDQIAHYTIISLLGRGGMGEVYLAQDSKLGRRVALKLLPTEFTGNELWLRRFHQEARTASALNHPNIITIYEIGESDGRHFIATEFVDGETLRQRMRNRTMELSETLDMAVKIAEALGAAHEAGIIHRDIKPENIMLRSDGSVKVLDFGLAKMAGTPQPSMALRTQAAVSDTAATFDSIPGMVMGTAAYASPEQSRGEEVDSATDVYSLGIVILESLTGCSLVDCETEDPDLEGRHLNKGRRRQGGEPDHTSTLDQHRNGPRTVEHIPEEISRIVNKATSKDKHQRHQTAGDLLIDLNRAVKTLEPAGELTQTEFSPRRLARTASRRTRKAVVAWATLAALCAAAIMAMTLRTGHNDSAPFTSVAVLPFVNEQQDSNLEYLADGMTEGLIRSLSQIPSLKVISRTSSFSFKGREPDPKSAGQELNVQTVLTGRVKQSGNKLSITVSLSDVIGASQLWTSQYSVNVEDALSAQNEISTAVAKRLQSNLSGQDTSRLRKGGTASSEAYQLYMRGRFFLEKRTREGMRKAADVFQQALQIDPNYALAHIGLADCYALPDLAPSAPEESYSHTRAATLRALAIDDSLAEAHTSLAWNKVLEWDWPGAEREFKRAIQLNPNYATAHNRYGVYLSYMRRYEESLAEMRKAQELDPISLMINTNIGSILSWAGHPDEAIEQIGKVLDMDPSFVRGRYRLGMVYVQKGMFKEAIAETQKAVSLDPGDPVMVAQLGAVYAMCRERKKALRILDKVKEKHRQSASMADAIATIYAVLNDTEQSLRWLNIAYEARDPLLGDINTDLYWNTMRSDPRFKDFLRRMGFPVS